MVCATTLYEFQEEENLQLIKEPILYYALGIIFTVIFVSLYVTRFRKKHLRKKDFSYLYNSDSGKSDPCPMEEVCTHGYHEFVAFVSLNPISFEEGSQVVFTCRKCKKKYYGKYPYRYGDVVSEEHY